MHLLIDYCPHPYQATFHRDPSRFKIVAGGRRVGKTKMCIQEALKRVLGASDQLVYWVAPTYKTAREVGFEELLSYLDQIAPAVTRVNYSHMTCTFTNGSQIVFKSGDNPDALRGRKIQLVILDEAAFIKPDIWKVIRPELADTGGSAILISTPNGMGDWFHTTWLHDGWSKYHWESSLNPIMTEDELNAIRSQMSQNEYDQEILAKFVTRAGRVYPDFDDSNIIKTFTLQPTDEICLGMDFGYANFTAIAFIAIRNGIVYIFDEIYINRTQIDEIVKNIYDVLKKHNLRKDKVKACYADPAGEAYELSSGTSPVDVMRQTPHNLPVIVKSSHIAPGLALVRSFIRNTLGERRLFVLDTCKETVRSLLGYQYNVDRKQQAKEEPLKDGLHDHMSDAVRYFFVNRFDNIKYVAQAPTQTDYTARISGSRRSIKLCGKCHRSFFSMTPKGVEPLLCNECK